MKRIGLALITVTMTLGLAVPSAPAAASTPPPGAFVVGGMGGHVLGENAFPGHAFRSPLRIKLTTAGGTPVAGVRVKFILCRAWGVCHYSAGATGGPQFVTSAGWSPVGVGITNAAGVATSPPVIAEGPCGDSWIETLSWPGQSPHLRPASSMWLLGVLCPGRS